MAIPQIVSTRNGVGSIIGYRDDLAQGDLIGLSLTNTIGVTQVLWEIIGRPEGSAAGGAGPEPIFLASGFSAAFTVDSDSGSFRLDGTYVVQATLNPGSPGELRISTDLVRLSGLTIPGPGSSVRTLRKLGGFESLEDTSIPTILQGWATEMNRWLELVREVALSGSSSTTLEQAYAHGTSSTDQTLVLHDAQGGGIIVDATQVDFTGASALRVNTPAGGPFVIARANGNVGIGTATPALQLHVAGTAPALRLQRTGGASLDVQNVGDELQFLNGATVLAKLEPTGGLRADLGVGIGTAPATNPVLALGAASGVPISGAGTARFRYNEVNGHAEWSENAGPYQQFAAMSSLFYLTIENHGTALTQRPAWNASTGLTAVDNAGATRTDVTANLSTGVAGGQSAFGGTNAGDALTLQGTTNSTAGNVKVVVGTSAGQGLKLVRTDGVELVEMLPYLSGSSPPLGVKIDGILSAPEISVGTVVNNDSATNQLTLVSGFGGPVGSSGLIITAAFGTGDATGYQVLIEPNVSQLANAFGILNTSGSPTVAVTAAGAATFAGPMTISNLAGPGFVKASSGGLLSVDTTVYTPTTRTVQGTSPILIAGGTAAVDLSANRVWSVATNGITYGFIQQATALSVLGRSANSTGNLADIATTSGSNFVLRESGGTIGWGTISAGSITGVFYQTVAAGGSALTQRGTLNFIAPLLAADNVGASRTDVSLTIDGTLAVVSSTLGRAALTGDVTAAAGSNTLTIANNAVTNAKFRQSSANTLVGNATGATANVSDIGLIAPLFLSGGNLVLDYDGSSLTLSGGTVLVRAALTGDVTAGAGLNSTTIAANAVTNAKFRQSAGLSVVGNSINATGNVADITATATGQVLQDLGTTIGWATLAYSSLSGTPTLFYQTVASFGTPLTQRPEINFGSEFNVADNSGSNRTDVTTASFPLVSQSSHAPTNAVNLGALTNGTLQQTVSAGISTPSAFNGTTGSVPFYTTNGQLAQNNTKLFWDNSNIRLGIGNGAPGFALDIQGSTTANTKIMLNSSASGAADFVEIGLINNLGSTVRSSLYFTSSAYTGDGGASALLFQNASGPIAFQGAGTGAIGLTVTKNGSGVPGDIQIARLNAGGIVKAAATTGQLSIATLNTDYINQAYQTVDQNGSALTQRKILNFTTSFSAVDNAGATRTDVDLANVGPGAGIIGGTGNFIESVTLNSKGQVTAATAASSPAGITYKWSMWSSGFSAFGFESNRQTCTFFADQGVAFQGGNGTYTAGAGNTAPNYVANAVGVGDFVPLYEVPSTYGGGGKFTVYLHQVSASGAFVTIEWSLWYTTDPTNPAAAVQLTSQTWTGTGTGFIGALGTVSFSTSVPAGALLFVAVQRTDTGAGTCTLLQFTNTLDLAR